METMSMVECEDKAKDEGFDSATFDLIGPSGTLKCKWLDAYMGAFMVDGQPGFLMTKDAKLLGLRCANFKSNRENT